MIDLENKTWPDLAETEKLLQATGDKHNVVCAATNKDIVGVRYYTRYMSSEQDVELSFSETGIHEDNPHSLCPQVYLRITKPLQEGKDLPSIDPKDFYDAKPGTSLHFEVTPELQWMKNTALLGKTSESWA